MVFNKVIPRSTEHTVIQLVDQLLISFRENKFTLDMFIDFKKAFDTVDNTILLKKLSMYGIKALSLKWFESYLTNCMQYIELEKDDTTSFLRVKCRGAQVSILGPLFFYVNDFLNGSSILDPFMFADDTNLLFSHQNIQVFL